MFIWMNKLFIMRIEFCFGRDFSFYKKWRIEKKIFEMNIQIWKCLVSIITIEIIEDFIRKIFDFNEKIDFISYFFFLITSRNNREFIDYGSWMNNKLTRWFWLRRISLSFSIHVFSRSRNIFSFFFSFFNASLSRFEWIFFILVIWLAKMD
jgi:hypothetical protein